MQASLMEAKMGRQRWEEAEDWIERVLSMERTGPPR